MNTVEHRNHDAMKDLCEIGCGSIKRGSEMDFDQVAQNGVNSNEL